MAGVSVLRDEARAAILGAGRRGFVRFLSEGDGLLISDAPRRCADGAGMEQMIRALEEAGFSCRIEEGLAYITPGKARLMALCNAQIKEIGIDWDGPLFDMQALCARLLREKPLELDEDGARLLVKTARILWQPKKKVLSCAGALRAMIAVRLREGNRGGLYEVGLLLRGWLQDSDA